MFLCLHVYTHNIPIKAIKMMNPWLQEVLTHWKQAAAAFLHTSPHLQGGCSAVKGRCHHCSVTRAGEAPDKQRLSALVVLSQGNPQAGPSPLMGSPQEEPFHRNEAKPLRTQRQFSATWEQPVPPVSEYFDLPGNPSLPPILGHF